MKSTLLIILCLSVLSSIDALPCGLTKMEERLVARIARLSDQPAECKIAMKKCEGHDPKAYDKIICLLEVYALKPHCKLTAATTTAATTTTTRSHGGTMVRPDGRCAGRRGGQPGKCDPNGESPCCSAYGWCGSSAQHCQCPDCIDFRFLVKENQDWYCGVTFDNKDGPISRTTTWDDALAFLGVNLNERGTAARGVVWMRGSNPHIPAILIGNGGEYGSVFDRENRHILRRCHNAYVDEVMNPKFD